MKNIEWVVFRDGVAWTDRLNSEAECLFHIQESVENDDIFDEDDYTYREMTKKEIDQYDSDKYMLRNN